MKCLRASIRVGWILLSSLLAFSPPALFGQGDTLTHGWPVAPFFSTHPITGVFCEFRNTLTSDHFHNGVDIPRPDGTAAYPVFDGVVTGIGTVASQGDNAYVRVRYTVGGLVKSDAYVHIAPNPLLAVGDSVHAYQTVLGNILTGLGHVHFTNGSVGAEMNGIRPKGGLTPYIDAYPPHILSVRFFLDQTETEFTDGRVSGPVDIRVNIAETSAADPSGLSSSTTNNGIYLAGYRVLASDGVTVVYEPTAGGVRYRFDSMPEDADVHMVFAAGSDVSTHIYTLTNGGGADAVNTTGRVPNGFWDTGLLAPGPYLVSICAEDTRGLKDSVLVPVRVEHRDVIPPAVPVLRSVIHDSTNRITIRWYPNPEPDLRGYRLYYTVDGTTWQQKESETGLPAGTDSVIYRNVTSGTIFFRLAAVDSAAPPNVSPFSDVYGVRLNTSAGATLIVDGFDRTEASGSWHSPSHPFAMIQGFSVPQDFSTCANDAVLDGSVDLRDFPVVVWVLGDESSDDETFSAAEQELVGRYLDAGGSLFVSGSEVAYDLDRPSGPTTADRDFLHAFLKTRYAGDDANEYTIAGQPSTLFDGLTFRYGVVAEGSPYDEDWPDYLTPDSGGSVLLRYGSAGGALCAATGYRGVFPGGTREGAVVCTGFPFETIVARVARDSLMRKVYRYFDALTGFDADLAQGMAPSGFRLEQNYPNPFNPETEVRYQVPEVCMVTLAVYDLLGRVVSTLVNEVKIPGEHAVVFDGSSLASGVYFYRLTVRSLDVATRRSGAERFVETRKMVLMK